MIEMWVTDEYYQQMLERIARPELVILPPSRWDEHDLHAAIMAQAQDDAP